MKYQWEKKQMLTRKGHNEVQTGICNKLSNSYVMLQVDQLGKVHDEILLGQDLLPVAGRPEHFHGI